MVNKCVVTNCKSGYNTGEKKLCFHFPEDKELREKWVYFVNRKGWEPTKNSVICIGHFEKKYVKEGKRWKLKWELHPVPNIHTDKISQPSILRTPVPARRSPRKRKLNNLDELTIFQQRDKVTDLNSLDMEHAPVGYNFKKLQESVQYYQLVFQEETGTAIVHGCISIDKEMHVRLTYKSFHIPLPEWFRLGTTCKLNRFSVLENFASYIRNKSSDYNKILQQLNEIQHYKSQGRPKYTSSIIRFALQLRYTSCQAYKLLVEQLPLPSLSQRKF